MGTTHKDFYPKPSAAGFSSTTTNTSASQAAFVTKNGTMTHSVKKQGDGGVVKAATSIKKKDEMMSGAM